MKRILTALAAAVAAAGPAAADTLSLSFSQNWTDNLFQTLYAEADAVTAAGLSWEKDLAEFSLLAGVDYNALHQNTGLSAASLSLGGDYLHALGEKTALYLSLEGDASFFRSEYSDFNHAGASFLAVLKTYLSSSSILKASAASEFRSYRYAPFDFLSQGLSVSLDKYFPSRTTFQAEAGWGLKYFLHPQTVGPSAGFTPAAFTASAGEGTGSGLLGNGGGQGGHGGGKGRGGGYAPVAPETEGKAVQIASLTARIGQGLGNRIGLRLAGLVQWNLSGENPFTSVEEYAMIENPTYDAFAWEGSGWNAQVSVLLPWNVNARLGYNRTDKTFPGIESLDLEGNTLGIVRKDGRDQWDLKAEKDFGRWSLILLYAYIRNESNDPLFNWSGGFISGGFQWSFGWGGK